MSETERKSRGRNRPEAIFPRMNGLSPHNPKHRRTLAEAWTERAIVQEVLAQSLWHHSANLPCFIHLPRRGVDCDRQAQLWRGGDMAVEVEVENTKLAQLVREIGRTIIVGRKGNVGSVFWSFDDCYPIDTVYYIETNQCSLYLYYVLQNLSFISTDVAVPGLNRNYAHSRVVLVPDMILFRLFEDTVAPLHGQIKVFRKQNATLAQARDLLLPRLMNGEISV